MEGLITFLIFAGLFYFMMRHGCGAHMTHGHGGNEHSHDDGKVAKYIDPVCSKEVEAEQGYGKMYQGSLYRFCSKDCLDKFDVEPTRYLEKEQEEKS